MDMSDIYKSIKSGDNDEALNQVIASFVADSGLALTVEQARIEYYEKLRLWAYPDTAELNDAVVKQNSGDIELEVEGAIQLRDYANECLAVKQRFPKE